MNEFCNVNHIADTDMNANKRTSANLVDSIGHRGIKIGSYRVLHGPTGFACPHQAHLLSIA